MCNFCKMRPTTLGEIIGNSDNGATIAVCDGGKLVIDVKGNFASFQIQFCPMCGECLKEKAAVEPETQPESVHDTLKKLAEPMIAFLRKHYDLHCQVIVATDFVKVTRDEIGVPFEIEDKGTARRKAPYGAETSLYTQ